MSTHNTPRLWPWAAALAVVSTIGAIQTLDAQDFETAAAQESREWMHAISVCHRAYGPSTQPEYNEQGNLVCVSRRGEVLAYRSGGK